MLQGIRVKNFKSLKDLDYKCANLNLLTGLNGAGKSSFVQLLQLLRLTATQADELKVDVPMMKPDFDHVTYDDLRYCYAHPEEKVSVSVDFVAKDLDVMTLHHIGDCENVGGTISRVLEKGPRANLVRVQNSEAKKIEDEVEARIEECKRGAREKHPGENEFKLLKWIDMEAFEKLRTEADLKKKEIQSKDAALAFAYKSLWKNMKMVSAFRGKPERIHTGGGEFENPNQWIFSDSGLYFHPEGENAAEFLSQYGMAISMDGFWATGFREDGLDCPMYYPGSVSKARPGENTHLIDQVNAWLSVVSPGVRLSVTTTDVGSEKVYEMKVGYGEGEDIRWFDPKNVGFGISYTLPVILTLLTSRQDDIVIIENPEAHLHPKGQAKMGELIARAVASGVQVFVETHSDHVINGIRVAVAEKILKPEDVNIAFFERKEHGAEQDGGADRKETYAEVRNIKVDDQGSLSEYPADFMDEWNNQLMELIS